jgi:hypothetical protein
MRILLLVLLSASCCVAQIAPFPATPEKTPVRGKGSVNVVADCGAKADGTTDDSSAINDCFSSHPGETIVFPLGVYFAAFDIIEKGTGTIARGEGMPRSNGLLTGSVIRFGQGAGWKIGTQDSRKEDCEGCVLEDMGMVGPDSFSTQDASSCIIPSKDGRGRLYGNGLATSNDLTDGTTINSNFVTVRNVWSGGFARYGFRCNGNSTSGEQGGWCDNASIEDTLAWANRGSGYFVSGTDSNASEMIQTRSYYSQMWGFELYPFLGMSTLARSAHTNHITLTKPGATYRIQTIGGNGTDATLITSEPIHGVGVGNIVVLADTQNWNGSYGVSAYDQKHTYTLKSLKPAPAAETAGTARLATCDEAWIAAGIDGGGVKNNAGAVTSVEINPYNEGDNGAGATGGGAAKYNPRQSIVIGGDQGPGFDVADGFAPAAWLTTDLGGFEIVGGAGFRNFVDNSHQGNNKITLAKGWSGNEANNSLLMIQDLTGPSSPNFSLEWRKTVFGQSPWYGLRTHITTDAPGLTNYSILFGYGATAESCHKGESAPNCSRPKVWLPNGFALGNQTDGARIGYTVTTTGKPLDGDGNPGDWVLNARPDNSECAAWVRQSGAANGWRCVPFSDHPRADSPAQAASNPTVSASQMVCDAVHRGQFHLIEGKTGVKDVFEVCAKDASDLYQWRQLY